MKINFKTNFFHRNKKIWNQGLLKWEKVKKKSILQIDHQRGHHVQIKDAVLVKIQIDLASYLKRQRCENYKENT